jgi:hypothetical protein
MRVTISCGIDTFSERAMLHPVFSQKSRLLNIGGSAIYHDVRQAE